MKTIEEIKQHEPIYLGDWSNCGLKQLIDDFSDYDENYEKQLIDLSGINILLAYYRYEDYNGEAFVLFEKDGQLYEVNGSHCSCYGLENQWEPRLTELKGIAYRLNEGHMVEENVYNSSNDEEYTNQYKTELKELLGV